MKETITLTLTPDEAHALWVALPTNEARERWAIREEREAIARVTNKLNDALDARLAARPGKAGGRG